MTGQHADDRGTGLCRSPPPARAFGLNGATVRTFVLLLRERLARTKRALWDSSRDNPILFRGESERRLGLGGYWDKCVTVRFESSVFCSVFCFTRVWRFPSQVPVSSEKQLPGAESLRSPVLLWVPACFRTVTSFSVVPCSSLSSPLHPLSRVSNKMNGFLKNNPQWLIFWLTVFPSFHRDLLRKSVKKCHSMTTYLIVVTSYLILTHGYEILCHNYDLLFNFLKCMAGYYDMIHNYEIRIHNYEKVLLTMRYNIIIIRNHNQTTMNIISLVVKSGHRAPIYIMSFSFSQ